MPLLDRRTSAFITRFKERALPDDLQWSYLPSGGEGHELVKDFLNQHYVDAEPSDQPHAIFSDDDIQRLFLVDASWPKTIRQIAPQLSLAVIHKTTRQLVAVALVRPSRIRYQGVDSMVASIPVVCIDQSYRHSPLAAILLAKCYRQLRQHCLADGALFFGYRRPFHCLHSADSYCIDLQQQEEQVYTKPVLSDYILQPYSQRDTGQVIQLINTHNDQEVIHPLYNDADYFYQRFRHYGNICSYCIVDLQRKVVGWFALRKPDDTDTGASRTPVTLFAWAGQGLSAVDVTYFALRQALLMKARYLYLPYDMAFNDENQQRLQIKTANPQQAYAISTLFYEEAIHIKLFDPWVV